MTPCAKAHSQSIPYDKRREASYSRDSWFQAPSIRSIADIATTVAVNALMPGAGIFASAALNMVDDAIFTLMDVSGGYASWEDAGMAFGKKALTSAATAKINVGFGGIATTAKGFGGVVAKTIMSGMKSYTTSMAASAINAMNWDSDGLEFRNDVFKDGLYSGIFDAGKAMANTFVQGSMGELNLFDGNKTFLSGTTFDTKSIQYFNNVIGGLAEQGVSYAMGQDAVFNLANFGMFGLKGRDGNIVQSGLLELHLNGDGATMNFGTSGMDASLGTIAASMSGLRDTLKITDAKVAALFGKREGISTLNFVNMLGYSEDTNNFALGRDIWSGKKRARYEDMAVNKFGYYNSDNPDEIVLSKALMGKGLENAAKLATAAAHEGTHMAGNLYESVAHQQGLATYAALVGKMGLQGDREFVGGMIAALMDPASYEENVGAIQNWEVLVKADGTHTFKDEQDYGRLKFTYLNPDGEEVSSYEIRDPALLALESHAGALAKVFGDERIEELLGKRLDSADTYDFQTLKDVLELSDDAIRNIQRTGRLPDNLNEAERLALAGEALIKNAGGKWNTDTKLWTGMDPSLMSLTGRVLEGGLYGWTNERGGYEFATAAMTMLRDPMSNFVRTSAEEKNMAYVGRDSILVTQRDLEGNIIGEPKMFNGLTTVQTLVSTEEYGFDQFVDQQLSSIYGGQGTIKVGPETLAEGAVGFTLLPYPDNSKVEKWRIAKGNPYLVAAFGSILAGTPLNANGSTSLSDLSIAIHPTENFGNTGCPVFGDFGGRTGVDRFTDFTSYLRNNLRLPYGFTMYGQIQQKYNPYIRIGR